MPKSHNETCVKNPLNWLFDWIDWDPKIQIRYIDAKHQLADMLTKVNFTHDEFNNLLQLFMISHSSSTCCTKIFSLISWSTMAKRIHKQEEERLVSKSRPAVDEYVFFYCDRFLRRIEFDCIWKSGGADSFGETRCRMSTEPNSFDAASTFQVRLKDAYLGGFMEEQRWDPSHQEEEEFRRLRQSCGWNLVRQKVAQSNKAWEKHLAHGASSSVAQDSRKNTEATWDHYLTYRRTHRTTWKSSSPWTGKRMENKLAILWKIWMWILLFGTVHEYHSSSSCSSQKTMTRIWDL